VPLLEGEALFARARAVRLIVLDVDGVLTDGTVAVSDTGSESKSFYIRDGAAIVVSQRVGLRVALLSGRPSGATTRRAQELGIPLVLQGGDKREQYERILRETGLSDAAVAYMGDDLLDLPVFARAGLAGAPADAAAEVLEAAHWISRFGGGRGAVRDFAELILRAQGQWFRIVDDLAADSHGRV
jgi:3-deoxy-D-manno-octulosonate 8-phosphate phosphatase (KDO 8-P phosphatase)